MKFTVEYPVSAPGYDPDLVRPAGMRRVVEAVEAFGYDAIAFTEHPAPSWKWLQSGGHETLDLTSALAFCAAITERVSLMTYLLVLPYHNPFAAAKALTTVDVLSGGRLIVCAGTGYLRSEFLAMGVDMNARNALFDEAVEVLRGVWSRAPFDHQGEHFAARGVAALPMPVQPGGPPILVGGNSALARRRAARLQGWSPLLVSADIAATTRTPALSSVTQLAGRIAEVRERAVAERGRDAVLQIQVQTPARDYLVDGGSAEQHRQHLGELTEAGVDRFVIRPPATSVAGAVDALQGYAETFGLLAEQSTVDAQRKG